MDIFGFNSIYYVDKLCLLFGEDEFCKNLFIEIVYGNILVVYNGFYYKLY